MRHLHCNHPTTPGAREACRMLHRLIAAATRRELEIEWVTPPDEECAGSICQVWIKNPRRSLDPCMLVTCSRGTPHRGHNSRDEQRARVLATGVHLAGHHPYLTVEISLHLW